MNTHETFESRVEIAGPSDRTFANTFAIVLAVIATAPLLSGRPVRLWTLATALAFAIIGLVRPAVLHTPNRLWMRFGLLLGRLTTPVVMFLMFFLVVTPIAFLVRRFGYTSLHLSFESARPSYWIDRQPPGPASETMSQQF